MALRNAGTGDNLNTFSIPAGMISNRSRKEQRHRIITVCTERKQRANRVPRDSETGNTQESHATYEGSTTIVGWKSLVRGLRAKFAAAGLLNNKYRVTQHVEFGSDAQARFQ